MIEPIKEDAISSRVEHVFKHYGMTMHARQDVDDISLTGSLWVYAIQCHEFVKIGVANDVKKRLASLQSGCPYELTLLAQWHTSDAGRVEDELHELLDKYRIRGEWFELPPNIVASIPTWKPA